MTREFPTARNWAFGYDRVGNRTGEQVEGAIMTASYNERNQLDSREAGGTVRVYGSVTEDGYVNVDGRPARNLPDREFEAFVDVVPGQNTFTVSATDGSSNTTTKTYSLTVNGDQIAYTYDLNGNLTSKDEAGHQWTYEWNAENQLTRVTQDAVEVATFRYDPLGRRVEKAAGGVTYSYLYDGSDILKETRSTGTTYTYIHGPGIDEPFAREDGLGVRTYYHADGLGSIVKMTDQAGNIIPGSEREYDAWGNLETGASEPGYAFTGREWDPETGLYYYRARYYDPKAGRFISEDPVVFEDGVNFYSYVGANPANWRDPTGNSAEVAVAAGWFFTGVTLPAWAPYAAAAVVTFGVTYAIATWWNENQDEDTDVVKPPFTGEPGTTCKGKKQSRRYKPDGYPDTDVDTGHAHDGAPDPHAHDWSRPDDGGPPTHRDRGPARPLRPGDPPVPPGYQKP